MPADLMITNGTILAPTGAQLQADVAIDHGRIVEVGQRIDPRRWNGTATQVIDATGSLVCPGFIDAHVHPMTGGLKLLRCSLYDATDAGSALDAVSAYSSSHPGPWIWGGGWSLEWFHHGTPTAGDLDRVIADRPVFLYNRDGHAAWVNSKALAMAGIDRDTPDPVDGRIERNSDRSPQGTLHEGAMNLVETMLPPVTDSEWEQGLLAGQAYLLSCGVTGWQDADVRPENDAAYLAVAGRGDLLASVVGALWWDRYRALDQVEELIARRARMAPGYRPTSVKLMLDGVAENYTASMIDPYLDGGGNETDNFGIDFIDPNDLAEIVSTLDRLGFQCHFHALGSRAVRNALNALEGLPHPARLRHHLAHLQVVDPADIERFRATGATANAQPLWACNEPQMIDLTLPFLTTRSATNQYPFRSLREAGVPLAMGSDWSVSTANVMRQVEVAVTRRSPVYRDREPLLLDQALSLGEALTAFSMGSARVNKVEDQVGSIALGKRADLVVLDRNPFLEAPIGEAKVSKTLIHGEVVFAGS